LSINSISNSNNITALKNFISEVKEADNNNSSFFNVLSGSLKADNELRQISKEQTILEPIKNNDINDVNQFVPAQIEKKDKLPKDKNEDYDKNIENLKHNRQKNENAADDSIKNSDAKNSNNPHNSAHQKETIANYGNRELLINNDIKKKHDVEKTDQKKKQAGQYLNNDELTLTLTKFSRELNILMGKMDDSAIKGQLNELAASKDELKNIMKNRGLSDADMFKSSVSRIKSLIEKIDANHAEKLINPQLRELIASAKELISKLNEQKSKHDAEREIKFKPEYPNSDLIKPEVGSAALRDENQRMNNFDNKQSQYGFQYNLNKQDGVHNRTNHTVGTERMDSRFYENLNDIIKGARVSVRDGQNASFSVKLYPKEFGSVNINLELDRGIINGRFLVDNSMARDAIVENIEYIRNNLREMGVQVGEFFVDIRKGRENFENESDDDLFPAWSSSKSDTEEKRDEFMAHSRNDYMSGRLDIII
jgi:flagellar hook-length control protein FliK